jgi:Helix-turn-helix domain
MSQWLNSHAVHWAYAQEGLSATEKDVLISFAIHANQRGYTWPGVDHMASTWNIDRKTVRRGIEALIGKRTLYRTKKRRGATGQVKVYRLPKVTYESGGRFPPFENETVPKASHKRPISGGGFPPNNINKEQRRISDQRAAKTLGNSIPNISSNTSDAFSSGSHQYQNVAARDHHKWPEFDAYCRSRRDKRGQPGQPTEKGFWTWLSKQNEYWRNKVRQNFDGEEGYELDGKFYTADEANRMAEKNPELSLKFRKAIKRDGKIQIVPKNTLS